LALAKILMVDDDKDVKTAVSDWLKIEKHDIELASTGEEGLEMLAHSNYDLLILDMSLPDISGIEVCEKFRQNGGDTPILFLTGNSQIEFKQMGYEAGADDYLSKPFNLKELALRLRALLRRGKVESASKVRYKRFCLTCTNEYDDNTEKCPIDSSPLSRVIDESLIGTVFAEKYDVISRLGSGGMSTVYRAKHLYIGKEVAIKVLKGNTTDSESLKRFQREARAASTVSHPGIVGVNDFGLTPEGKAFLVMDYLEGETLSHFLDHAGTMPLADMINIADQLCEALNVAHENGIIHRDLKPSNIMLVRGGRGETVAKIVDFGLAKILDEDNFASQKITQTGDCFGSPPYMSPEQCMGKKVDHLSDIYALGCILFECLTGNPPIIGANASDTITKHVQGKPAPFPEGIDVPKEIKLIIYKALHKEPMWRPQTAMEIKRVLTGSIRQS
jgi:serine/threonine protein kinase